MSEQLSLFTELDFDLEFYDVVFYSGRMKDTNGDEIYFVRTVKHSLTKYQAKNYCRDMNKKLFHGSSDYFDIIKRGEQTV